MEDIVVVGVEIFCCGVDVRDLRFDIGECGGGVYVSFLEERRDGLMFACLHFWLIDEIYLMSMGLVFEG